MTKLRAALRRWWWLLMVGTVLGAVIGAASMAVRPDPETSYIASSVILFDLNSAQSSALEAAQQAALQVERGAVPLRAAEILERNDPEALVGKVAVDVNGDSLSLTIAATDTDEDTAVEIADAFTTAFLERSNAQELAALDNQIALLERQVAGAQRRVDNFDEANPLIAPLTDTRVPLVQERTDLVAEVTRLTQQLDDTRQQSETTTGPYDRLGEAAVKPAGTGMLALPGAPALRVGLLAGLGLFVAVLLVALIERWNPRIDTKDEAEEITQLPVLTMVPYLGRRSRRKGDVVDPEHFGGGHAESYRRLRSAIQYVSTKRPRAAPSRPLYEALGAPAPPVAPVAPVAQPPDRARSFLIVSSSPGEGKTSTVAYASFALAEADVPTLAINADCRRPTLHERLGVSSEPGLTDLSEYRMDRPEVDDVVQAGPIDDLWVVASGHPGPLTSEIAGAIDQIIDTATNRGATVVIDSSPLLATTDVMELVPMVDHVVFVIRNGKTTRREALEGLEMLRLRDAPLLGCVCVGSAGTRRKYSYYQSYYYHSTAQARPEAAVEPVRAPHEAPANGSGLPDTAVAPVPNDAFTPPAAPTTDRVDDDTPVPVVEATTTRQPESSQH